MATEKVWNGNFIHTLYWKFHLWKQLTPENVLPEIRILLDDNVGHIARLAMVLLVEQKLGQESEWYPYMSNLPRKGELHCPIPFADFLNHDGDSDAILLGDEHKQVSEV
ncbi:hypothetical protein C5167_034393 [Papaver somniferum]|uniref:SET domain-containing protein n=1 Tax=Papaver somniferum TaxID=3469 RepID=A0A4Y7KFT3_PAPSO|nr:hypothetical protein C5167_034393 [Papaver somniferum]